MTAEALLRLRARYTTDRPKFVGPTGPGGPTVGKSPEQLGFSADQPGTNAGPQLVPPVPPAWDQWDQGLRKAGPGLPQQKTERIQRLNHPGTAGTSGTTKNEYVRKCGAQGAAPAQAVEAAAEPAPPIEPCYVCGSPEFWVEAGVSTAWWRQWRCSACHPPDHLPPDAVRAFRVSGAATPEDAEIEALTERLLDRAAATEGCRIADTQKAWGYFRAQAINEIKRRG